MGEPKQQREQGGETLMKQLKLFDQAHNAIGVRHYRIRTETACVQWMTGDIFFHEKKHPRE